MSSFIVCAFYTENTPYEAEVLKLEADAELCKLEFYKQGYPNTGSWVRNCGLKPNFLAEMLQKFKGKNIVYIDADARIRRIPELFETIKADIGVHYWRGKELLSGTIFLRNNDRVKALVAKWAEAQEQSPETWDQKTLQAVLAKDDTCEVLDIPPRYVKIHDKMTGVGRPIIEHFQASRRLKRAVEVHTKRQYPEMIGKVKLREAPDGTIYISRHDKDAIAWLDKHAHRLKNQLRWIPIYGEKLELEALREIFEGKVCQIVGKGPSLDYLRADHFDDGPIIALNEAALQVETLELPNKLFCLQQDAKLRDTCYCKSATMLISNKAANFYAKYDGVFVFDSRQYNLPLNSLSVSAAIAIARSLGATGFAMMCFDACVTGHLTYAKCIKYDVTWGGSPDRFRTHRRKIEKHLVGMPRAWVIPKAPVAKTSDTPQQ